MKLVSYKKYSAEQNKPSVLMEGANIIGKKKPVDDDRVFVYDGNIWIWDNDNFDAVAQKIQDVVGSTIKNTLHLSMFTKKTPTALYGRIDNGISLHRSSSKTNREALNLLKSTFNLSNSVDWVAGARTIKNSLMNDERMEKTAALKAKSASYKVASDSTYHVQHRAPISLDEDYPLHNIPNEVYSAFMQNVDSDSMNRLAFSIIRDSQDKPNKTITIYRALPKEHDKINHGDWVTTIKAYAVLHSKSDKNWHVISKRVKASQIYTDGNSMMEFGYRA